MARNIRQLDLRESEEMKEDLAHIERLATTHGHRFLDDLLRGMPRGQALA